MMSVPPSPNSSLIVPRNSVDFFSLLGRGRMGEIRGDFMDEEWL